MDVVWIVARMLRIATAGARFSLELESSRDLVAVSLIDIRCFSVGLFASRRAGGGYESHRLPFLQAACSLSVARSRFLPAIMCCSMSAPACSWSCAASAARSEEHTSELQSLMRISYAVFCLKKNKITEQITRSHHIVKKN